MAMASPGPAGRVATATPAATSYRRQAALFRADDLGTWVRYLAGEAGAGAEAPLTATAARLLAAARRELAAARDRDDGAFLRLGALLDSVEVELLRIVPKSVLDAALPEALYRARIDLPENDPRRVEVEDAVAAGRPPSRDAVVAATGAANARRLAVLTRNWRRQRLAARAVLPLTVLAVVLALAGAWWPDALSFCTSGAPVICPSGGRPRPSDVALIELCGLLGGSFGAATILRAVRGVGTPVSAILGAALLKLPAGALTAVAGLFLLLNDVVPGFGGLDTQAQILAFAVVFGVAQQLITAPVDRAVAATAAAAHRPGLLHTRSPLPPAPSLPSPPAAAVPEAEPRRPAPRETPARAAPSRARRRVLSALVAGAASAIAFVPLAVSGHEPVALAAAWVATLLGAGAVYPGLRRSARTGRPPPGAFLVAVGAAVGPYAITAVFWLIAEAAGYGFGAAVAALFDAGWRPGAIAAWAGAVVGVVLSLGTADLVVGTVDRFLIRYRASAPSTYERLAERRRFRIGVLAAEGSIVAAVVLIARWGTGTGFLLPAVATVLLAVVGMTVLTAAERRSAVGEPPPGSRAMAAVLARAGWEVIPQPRLGSGEVDPLLRRVDLCAQRSGLTLVIRIMTSEDTTAQPGWLGASELLVAADGLRRHAGPGARVDPVLVLLGTRPDESLRRIAAARSIRLLHGTDVGRIAEQLAGLDPESAPVGAP